MLLKNCMYIITQDEKRQILEGYDILISGNKIVKIEKNISIEDHIKNQGINEEINYEIIDCSDKIVMPGLINTHAHLGMHSLKGLCDDETLFNWLDIINKKEAEFTVDEILDNTREGIIECIKTGTTCVYDSYKFATERIKVFEELGMRGFVSSTVQKEKHLKHVIELMGTHKSELVGAIVAAHSPYRCDESLLRKIVEISNKYNLIKRIHISETKKEVDDLLQQKGMRPIEYLHSLGFLDNKALLVHATWVNNKEIKLISKHNCSISHNPISNMKLASGGVTPVIEMLNYHINIGLGTDSVVSNNSLDMFEELKVAAILHKHHNNDPKAMTFQKVLDMATINGAVCLGLEKLGSIKPDFLADIITLDTRCMTPINNLVSNIIYCANGNNVCETIINGRVVMRNKEIV